MSDEDDPCLFITEQMVKAGAEALMRATAISSFNAETAAVGCLMAMMNEMEGGRIVFANEAEPDKVFRLKGFEKGRQ